MNINKLDAGTNQVDGTWQDYAHAILQKEQQESEVVQKKSKADSEGEMNRLTKRSAATAKRREQVELLTGEKTQTMDERGYLETRLEKTRALLAAKSAELKEETEILERCKEDRTASRAKLDAQVSERNEFTRAIMDQWSTSKPLMTDDERGDVTENPDELWSAWAGLVTDLVAARKQVDMIEEQLKVTQRAHEAAKMMFDEFIRTMDWHLFVKGGQEREETLAVDKELHEYLAIATENVSCCLTERQALRNHVEEDPLRFMR
ncbi:hypothetical protein PsorP6_006459 [Peronosclerospora sorghi]|uniref:Uncharacterized protein n=1 Tax=Peronosclerospora sorghi TaxID=230839 RepID=A0ACC0W4D8_9STRA|nr:hypothetical protein PsorP6_006459 [Peronosclerospora sorghi]